MSDNPISAGNQQERLCSYLAGFADGEGSFNISFRKRKDYRYPWKISACFNISQKEKAILEVFQKQLGCGTLRSRPDGVWYFEVNTLDDIRKHVIPFFHIYPFLSQKKQRDFRIFCALVALITHGVHLDEEGVRLILELRREMNDGGKRKFSEHEILGAYENRESSETIRQTSFIR